MRQWLRWRISYLYLIHRRNERVIFVFDYYQNHLNWVKDEPFHDDDDDYYEKPIDIGKKQTNS